MTTLRIMWLIIWVYHKTHTASWSGGHLYKIIEKLEGENGRLLKIIEELTAKPQ